MRYFVVGTLLALSVLGCKSDITLDRDFAYFGGEIINPNKDYITLYGPEMSSTDTIYLDANNRFIHKIEELKPGIHHFMHGGEYQMIIVEQEDSIMCRLNTIDFDESLVYSGKGSKKNNFYLKEFLNNELENKKLYKHCKLEPEAFENLLSHKRKEQLLALKKFMDKKGCSDLFEEIAKARIDYNYYASKEIYPFVHFGNKSLIHNKHLPDNFYDYRKNISYNASHLSDTYTYNRFLFCHFNNLALNDYYVDDVSHKEFNRYSKRYNVAKLELIDSLITNKYIKNNLLIYSVKESISKNKDYLVSQDLLERFIEKSSNEDHKKEVSDFVTSLSRLRPGNTVPNVKLMSVNDSVVDLESLVQCPTVIYFWSSNFKMHYRNSHYKAKKYKKKFPNVNFIAININDNKTENWKGTLEQLKFGPTNEYRFELPKDGKKIFALNSIDKVIVLNKDKTIVNSNANLFDDNFGKELAMISH